MRRAVIPIALLFAIAPCVQAARPAFAPRTWQRVTGEEISARLVGQQGDAVTLQTADNRSISLSAVTLSTADLRYLKNVRDASDDFRAWNFTSHKPPMEDAPAVVRGCFVRWVCEDLKHSEAVIELIREDYSRRFYPVAALSPADQQHARTLRDKAGASRAKPAVNAGQYKPYYKEYQPGKGSINFHETEHFLFHWGNDRAGSGRIVFEDPAFLANNFQWFERVWDFFETQTNAPMPMAGAAEKRKINVYVTGTGLPRHKEGFAFGSEAVIIHPGAMAPGSSVVGHEFTHVIQFYSGGYRDSPYVGWFWECHGNWSSHQFMPAYPPALEVYFERQHYELNSSRMNYGSWPFLQYLAEHPRFGPGFCYQIWTASRRDERSRALEDPLQTIMRLGVEKGLFKGDGVADFGDLIGQMAAQNVDWDYAPQYFYHRMARNLQRHSATFARTRTLLEPVPDRAGYFRPIHSHTPRQFGVNQVELLRAEGSNTVEIQFEGLIDDTEGSDWRATLVAIDSAGKSRYSRMLRGSGRLVMSLTPDEKRVALAIAATPKAYKSLDFRPGYGIKRRYPYEVSFKGCVPAGAPPAAPQARALAGAPHPNGGGFVARSAKVAASAFVGPEARVLDGARVTDRARIEGRAVVANSATVSDEAVVSDWARVRGQAKVTGRARVRGCAVIGDKAQVTEDARVIEYVAVNGNGILRGSALVKGWGEINLTPEAPVGGGTIAGEDLEVHLTGRTAPIDGGLLYGYLNADLLKRELTDNHHLYAHWDFEKPRGVILADSHADCDGVLRGGARLTRDGDRGTLLLDGKGQYALLEGHVVDASSLTMDLRIKWNGGAAEQRLFHFGSAGASMYCTPRDSTGKAALILQKGTERLALAAPALPAGRWVRLTLSVGPDMARLHVDGTEVASAQNTLRPDVLNAGFGYLGHGPGGADFSGALDDVRIYRRAMTPAEVDTAIAATRPTGTGGKRK